MVQRNVGDRSVTHPNIGDPGVDTNDDTDTIRARYEAQLDIRKGVPSVENLESCEFNVMPWT